MKMKIKSESFWGRIILFIKCRNDDDGGGVKQRS